MSSTNKTVTIELSQYVGTDKPTYLTDYNGDMLKIDTAIAADRDSIATAQNTANNASSKADTNTQSINTLNETVNGSGTGLAPRVTNLESSVNTINELIGNGEPTTTNKTLIGAINEVNANVKEIAHFKGMERISVAHDGTKTVSDLLTELASALQTRIDAMSTTARWLVASIGTGFGYEVNGANDLSTYISKSTVVGTTTFSGSRSSTNASTDSVNVIEIRFGASKRANFATITTGSVNVGDKLADVATSDVYADILKYDVE